MIKVGVTGGIGSGKTTVCNIFKVLGVPIYNSDIEARRLIDNHKEIISKVSSLFGDDIYQNGQLDRKRVGELVFKNKDLLEKLNAIVHPHVAFHFESWIKEKLHCKFIIKEAAILFESGGNKQVDKVITVAAPEELRIKRVMDRDNITNKEVMRRIKKQLSDDEKIKMSDYVIYCNNEKLVIPQVLNIYQEVLKMS